MIKTKRKLTVSVGILLLCVICAFWAAISASAAISARADTVAVIGVQGVANVTVTDLGDGMYNLKGKADGAMAARFDPIEVESGSVVHMAVTMRGAGNANEFDTWMAIMLGTDSAVRQYGPNEYSAQSGGAYVGLLMRFDNENHYFGNVFNMGALAEQPSIPDKNGVSKKLECVFTFGDNNVSVNLGGENLGTLPIPQSVFTDGAYFGIRTHGTGGSTADYDIDVRIADKATASGVNYDLAEKAETVTVPFTLGGSTVEKILGADGVELSPETCEVKGTDIILGAALFDGAEEDDVFTFTIRSSGGDSVFKVTVTDTTRITFPVSTQSFDKAVPADIQFAFGKSNITDIGLVTAEEITDDDYELTDDKLTFKKEYLSALGYGAHTYGLAGKRVSGKQTDTVYVTVTVSDGRMPSVEDDGFTVDAALIENKLVAVNWYDGKFMSLETAAGPVENSGYSVSVDGITFNAKYLEALDYGVTVFTVTTDKNNFTVTVTKVDNRLAEVDENIFADKINIGDNFDIAGVWYAETVQGVKVDGKQTEYVKTVRAVRLSGDFVRGLTLGEHTVEITTDRQTITVTVTVTDSRIPVRTDYAAFDTDFPRDLVIAIEAYDNKLIEVRRSGCTLTAAEIKDGNIILPRGYAQSLGLKHGDEIALELVYTAANGETRSITICVQVISSALGDMGEFALGGGDFTFEFTANGGEPQRVRVGGIYVPFAYVNGVISVPADALDAVNSGAAEIAVETNAYVNKGVITFTDSRKPSVVYAAEYFAGDYEIEIKTYAYSVTAVAIDGTPVQSGNFTVSGNKLTLKQAALSALSEGNHKVTLTATLSEGEQTEFTGMFTVAKSIAPVISQSFEYNVSDGGALGVNIDLKNNLSIQSVLINGREIDKSLWRVVSYGSIMLGEGAFTTLESGEYTFTVVCDRGSGDFTVTVVNGKVSGDGGETAAPEIKANIGASVGIGIGIGAAVAAVVAAALVLTTFVTRKKSSKEER